MNWKKLFSKTILDRGYEYYCDGAVEDFYFSDNIISAAVAGSEDYEVEIVLSENKIEDMYCSCPYAEDGHYCKHIVFITGYSDYIGDGYEVEALHYLLKPVDKLKLFAVLDRYIKRHTPENEITVRCEDKMLHLSLDMIMYCEAVGKKTHIQTKEQVLICETGIGSFSNNLSSDFISCHRSYIVNLRYVRSIGKTEIVLDNDDRVSLSRRLYKDVNEKFISFYAR